MKNESLLTVGASHDSMCGVRDWAGLLDHQLRGAGCLVESLWWDRSDSEAVRSSTELSFPAWWRKLNGRFGDDHPDAVIWHYSVFCYSHRGVPVFAPLVARCLGRKPAAVVAVLHEFAYPWRCRGWRGHVWAATQRAALVTVVLAANGIIVATEERERWLRTRRWLPHRPVITVPVFSTVPTVASAVGDKCEPPAVGVFGYASEDARIDLVTGAVALLAEWGRPVQLVLVGAPGAKSSAGRAWTEAASRSGCANALEFTGVLPVSDVGPTLAGLDLVVHPSNEGPTSRKTTLAACLAGGQCIVALAGNQTWDALRRDQIVALSAHRPEALATIIDHLLGDDSARASYGRRAQSFYESTMTPDRAVEAVRDFVAHIATGARG